MSLLLDTCGLLYWTLAPERLTPRAAEAIAKAESSRDGIHLCSMSLWEIAWKERLGKLSLGQSIPEFVRRLERLPMLVHPVDTALWLASVDLPWDHRDPVDRVVVALATSHSLPILTSDRQILDFYPGSIW